MEQVVYSTDAALVRADLGVSIVLENYRSFTQGKGDPKSPDFIPPKFEDRLQTRVRCEKVKMNVAHMALHSSLNQALPMWVSQIQRELDKIEDKPFIPDPKDIKTPADFAAKILLKHREEESKPY